MKSTATLAKVPRRVPCCAHFKFSCRVVQVGLKPNLVGKFVRPVHVHLATLVDLVCPGPCPRCKYRLRMHFSRDLYAPGPPSPTSPACAASRLAGLRVLLSGFGTRPGPARTSTQPVGLQFSAIGLFLQLASHVCLGARSVNLKCACLRAQGRAPCACIAVFAPLRPDFRSALRPPQPLLALLLLRHGGEARVFRSFHKSVHQSKAPRSTICCRQASGPRQKASGPLSCCSLHG